MSKGGLSIREQESACHILEKLSKHPASTDFLEPVDYQGLGLLDYPRVIKTPMDLGTVRNKLLEDSYSSLKEFMKDISLIWDNCKSYNEERSVIVKRAEKLERIAKKLYAKADAEEVSFEEKVDLSEKIRRVDMSVLETIIGFIRQKRPKSIRDFGEGKELVSLEGIDRTMFRHLTEMARAQEDGSTQK